MEEHRAQNWALWHPIQHFSPVWWGTTDEWVTFWSCLCIPPNSHVVQLIHNLFTNQNVESALSNALLKSRCIMSTVLPQRIKEVSLARLVLGKSRLTSGNCHIVFKCVLTDFFMSYYRTLSWFVVPWSFLSPSSTPLFQDKENICPPPVICHFNHIAGFLKNNL